MAAAASAWLAWRIEGAGAGCGEDRERRWPFDGSRFEFEQWATWGDRDRVRRGSAPSGDRRTAGGDDRDLRAGAAVTMIAFSSGARVWLTTGHTDMRKGQASLSVLVRETLKHDPHLCVGRDYVAQAP